MAVKALESYYDVNPQGTRNTEEGKKTKPKSRYQRIKSLQECYGYLKSKLNTYIDIKNYKGAIKVYQLLGKVAKFAKEYKKAIKYYTQSVL